MTQFLLLTGNEQQGVSIVALTAEDLETFHRLSRELIESQGDTGLACADYHRGCWLVESPKEMADLLTCLPHPDILDGEEAPEDLFFEIEEGDNLIVPDIAPWVLQEIADRFSQGGSAKYLVGVETVSFTFQIRGGTYETAVHFLEDLQAAMADHLPGVMMAEEFVYGDYAMSHPTPRCERDYAVVEYGFEPDPFGVCLLSLASKASGAESAVEGCYREEVPWKKAIAMGMANCGRL